MSRNDQWQKLKTRIAIEGARAYGFSSSAIAKAAHLSDAALRSEKTLLTNDALDDMAEHLGLTLADLLVRGDPEGSQLGLSAQEQRDASAIFGHPPTLRPAAPKQVASKPLPSSIFQPKLRPAT